MPSWQTFLVWSGSISFMVALALRILHRLISPIAALHPFERLLYAVGGVGGIASAVYMAYTGNSYEYLNSSSPPVAFLILQAVIGVTLCRSAANGEVRTLRALSEN